LHRAVVQESTATELGLFLPTGNNGWICSTTSPQYLPSWGLARDIATRAEGYGLTFVMTMVKFRGFGGRTRFWEHNLETVTLVAALAAATERIKTWASIAIPTLHPAMVARMASTIDSVAPGRFGINIVSGWNPSEYSQMGLWPSDDYLAHRYDYASEYVTILRALWANGRSNFQGEHFALEDCVVEPRPEGEVAIIAAGNSPRGLRFAAEFADFNFRTGASTPEDLARCNRELAAAGAALGRTLRTLISRMVILGDDDEDARRKVELYNEGTDHEAMANWNALYAADAGGTSSQMLKTRQSAVGATTGAPIVGSAATVAARLNEILAVPGTGGLMMIFDDYVEGLDRFGRDVVPWLDWESPRPVVVPPPTSNGGR
jgi:pyrimidine oxygenase